MDGFRFRKLKSADNVERKLDDDSLVMDHVPSSHMEAHNDGLNVSDVAMIIHDEHDVNAAATVRHPELNGKYLLACKYRLNISLVTPWLLFWHFFLSL